MRLRQGVDGLPAAPDAGNAAKVALRDPLPRSGRRANHCRTRQLGCDRKALPGHGQCSAPPEPPTGPFPLTAGELRLEAGGLSACARAVHARPIAAGLVLGRGGQRMDESSWADATFPTTCWECSTCCGALARVRGGKVVAFAPNAEHPYSKGAFCIKGMRGAPGITYSPNRLLYPMRRVGARGSGKWSRISWDLALDEMADAL